MNTRYGRAFLFAALVFLPLVNGNAQTEKHTWRAFVFGKTMQWYDSSQLDTVNSPQFSVWVIELHQTPFLLDGFEKKVLRTKTLYHINRDMMRFGISKTVYYDNTNREITRISYDNDAYHDELKMPFPVMKNSLLAAVLSELAGIQSKRK